MGCNIWLTTLPLSFTLSIMNFPRRFVRVVGLLGLAGCQTNTDTNAETNTAAKPAAAVPAPLAVPEGVGPPFF